MTETVFLIGAKQKNYACSLIMAADDQQVMTLKKRTRSVDQNAKMWAMINDLRRAKAGGRDLTADQWKSGLMTLCGVEIKMIEGLDGTASFPDGLSSKSLTVAQMADLITVIYAYGDRHGVAWSEKVRDWPE